MYIYIYMYYPTYTMPSVELASPSAGEAQRRGPAKEPGPAAKALAKASAKGAHRHGIN